MKQLIIYHSNVQKYGGIETLNAILLKALAPFFDITFMYDFCSPNQLEEYSKYVKCKPLGNQRHKADVVISQSLWGRNCWDNIETNCRIQVIHADLLCYALMGIFRAELDKRITDYVCVSEQSQKSFKELHKKESTVIYNLVKQPVIFTRFKNPILKLISVTRMSSEKGIQRCIDFAKLIPVPYSWEIYGEGGVYNAAGTNIKFMGYGTNLQPKIAEADYLVQLSETEGYCYSVVEALQQRTPVLITPFPSGLEQVTEGQNGYFIPFDLKGIDFYKIINHIPKPQTYKSKSDVKDWVKFINLAVLNIKTMKIKIIGQNETFKIGEIVDISEERAKSAIERGLAELVKKEKKETIKLPKL